MNEQKDSKIFLSPSGAIISIICFFLPWVRFSCMGEVKNSSGADMGGYFWLVFVAALAILLIFFIFYNRQELVKAKPLIILSSLIALGVILFQYIKFAAGENTEFGRVKPEDIGLSIQFGGIGTLIGFILSLIGSFFLKSGKKEKQNPDSNF